MTTFAQHASNTASEKITLATVVASKRLLGWSLYAGSTYFLSDFDTAVIVSLEDAGTPMVLAASLTDCVLTPGSYYLDRAAKKLYAQSSALTNLNGNFIGLAFMLFYSTHQVALPWDLATGFEVDWLPLLKSTSAFGVELDNSNQLGVAIEGSGNIVLTNDLPYWRTRYDKLVFENQKCEVFAWSRNLPASEAKILFRGRIQTKSYTEEVVTFNLKDALNALRAPIPLANLEDVVGARLPLSLKTAKQRAVYGYVFGHKPTPIDAVLQGYPLTGTVDLVNGSTSVVGTGTQFLAQVSPDDELIFVSPIGNSIAVASVTDDLNLELNEAYTGPSVIGTGVFIRPALPKRYINRIFLMAGHALREPSTTISVAMPNNLNRITVADPSDILPGDSIVIGSENSTVQRIFDNQIKLLTDLLAPPTVSTVVKRPSVTNAALGTRGLILTRDYTYDPVTAILTLDPLAEFNIAPVITIKGTLTFTSTSRSVTATGAQFKTQLKPGDWVKAAGQFDFFEVLTVIDDNSLTLRTPASYTSTSLGLAKRPEYYAENSSVLTVDLLGKTADGLTSGTFLKTAPQMVQDLLLSANIENPLDTASFDLATILCPQRLGMVIPKKFEDRNSPKLKDAINDINKSVFGSLVQNASFDLTYHVFRPVREQGIKAFIESDILKFAVKSVSDKIAKNVRLRYAKKEFDQVSRADAFLESLTSNLTATYLSKTENELLVETLLVDANDARIASSRWAFIIGVASTVVSFSTKMQGALLSVNDRLEFSHEKMFNRVGSNQRKKIAAVQAAKKTGADASIDVEDLSSAFSRCVAITENGFPNYASASDSEKFYGSFVTDLYGMQGNDPETFGVNLIW